MQKLKVPCNYMTSNDEFSPLVRVKFSCIALIVVETQLSEASEIKSMAEVNNETIMFHFTHLMPKICLQLVI